MRGSLIRVRPRVTGITAVTAVTAIAAMTGAAAVLTAGPAAAGTTRADTARLLTSGFADASGVHLQLGAPFSGGLGGQLEGQRLQLDLAHAHGTHQLGDPCSAEATKATADASIATGTGITESIGGQTPLSALNRGAHADLSAPGPVSDSYGSIPDNPLLTGKLGPVHAEISGRAGNSVSDAGIVDLEVGPLGQELPAESLDKLTSRLDVAGNDLQQTLDGVLPNVTGVLGDLARDQPDSAAGEQARELLADLEGLQGRLPSLLADLSGKALLDLEGLAAHQRVARTDSGVRAHAEAKLGSASLLGGLLSVEGFHNSATASAGGEPGTAEASARPEAFDVEIAGLLNATYGRDGLSLPALKQLPADSRQQLNAPLGRLMDQFMVLLNQGGLALDLAAHRTEEAGDGTSAIAESGGLLVGFRAPGTEKSSFALIIGKAVASVAAEPGRCEQAPPPAEPEPEGMPPLAYTGPRIPHSGLVGMGLLGAAGALAAMLVIRRRRPDRV